MKNFIRVMKALSDPNRARILKLLQQKTLCVNEITGIINLAQPTVSKHLKILENAGLVVSQKRGLWVNLKNVHIELDTSDIQKVLSMALDDDRDQALIFKPDW